MALGDIVKRLFGMRASAGQPPGMEGSETASWQKALSDFGFSYWLATPGAIETEFLAEQKLGVEHGYSPILVVARGTWNSTPISAERRTKRALALISERHNANAGRAFLSAAMESIWDETDLALFDALCPVEVPSPPPGILLLRHGWDGARPVDQVAIMRIPTASSAWIPAYLDWDDWTGLPSPPDFAAVCQHWDEIHGARLVAMSADSLEFSVERPPRSHAEAVQLLKEHLVLESYRYSARYKFLEEGAALLMNRRSWLFSLKHPLR
jgi:hypothetical protein